MTTEKERKKRFVVAGISAVLGLALGIAGTFYALIPKTTKKYPLDKAAKIMHDYLKDPALQKNAIAHGYGGEFPATLFSNAISCLDDSCGIYLWFCQDPISDEIFLALEEKEAIYSYADMPSTPTSVTLYRPSQTFKYPMASIIDFPTIRSYLRDDDKIAAKPVPISKGEVDAAIQKFRSNFGQYCKYNFSFVSDNKTFDLKDCLRKAKSNGYVRYYFAFEETDPDNNNRPMPNKIRIVFVATDNRGDNLITTTKLNMDDPILQSSWPPPPY